MIRFIDYHSLEGKMAPGPNSYLYAMIPFGYKTIFKFQCLLLRKWLFRPGNYIFSPAVLGNKNISHFYWLSLKSEISFKQMAEKNQAFF